MRVTEACLYGWWTNILLRKQTTSFHYMNACSNVQPFPWEVIVYYIPCISLPPVSVNLEISIIGNNRLRFQYRPLVSKLHKWYTAKQNIYGAIDREDIRNYHNICNSSQTGMARFPSHIGIILQHDSEFMTRAAVILPLILLFKFVPFIIWLFLQIIFDFRSHFLQSGR